MNAKRYQLRIPNPLESFEQAQRFEHRDLAELDGFELWQEQERVKWALSETLRQNEIRCKWLFERFAAVRRERALRGEMKRSRHDHV
ncbi:MAG TPA: hypothetical protein VMV15_07480 [Candidatus Binataceae bacterium]|nr:hypothetical protein [Candidatus Binataceae bacterium]